MFGKQNVCLLDLLCMNFVPTSVVSCGTQLNIDASMYYMTVFLWSVLIYVVCVTSLTVGLLPATAALFA